MVSNKNSNSKFKIPQLIQSPKTIKQVYLYKQTSKKIKEDTKKVNIIEVMLIITTPFLPRNLPKKPVEITLIKGRYKTNKYIKLF